MHQTDNAAGRSFHTEWFAPTKPGARQSAEGALEAFIENISTHMSASRRITCIHKCPAFWKMSKQKTLRTIFKLPHPVPSPVSQLA